MVSLRSVPGFHMSAGQGGMDGEWRQAKLYFNDTVISILKPDAVLTGGEGHRSEN